MERVSRRQHEHQCLTSICTVEYCIRKMLMNEGRNLELQRRGFSVRHFANLEVSEEKSEGNRRREQEEK